MKKLSSELILLASIIFIIASCSKDDYKPKTNNKVNSLEINKEMSTSGTPSIRTDFILGINGHPLGTAPYKSTSATKQIEIIKDLGMTYYRIDVETLSDGSITVPSLFDPLRSASAAQGVKLLPMIYTRTLDMNASATNAYNAGKAKGANFAEKYGAYFEYYELGNELDLKLLLKGSNGVWYSGTSSSHYDINKLKIVAAYLKGMDYGIKSKDSGAKTMVNGSWLHYGYLLLLQKEGVKFDVVAWHWYSEMEGVAAKAPYYIPDITKKLSEVFPGKPIWFNEVNKRHKSISTIEIEQDDFLKSFIIKCKNNQQVKAIIIYELFDEPEKSSLESNYGIIKWLTQYSGYKYKLAAETLDDKSTRNYLLGLQ